MDSGTEAGGVWRGTEANGMWSQGWLLGSWGQGHANASQNTDVRGRGTRRGPNVDLLVVGEAF